MEPTDRAPDGSLSFIGVVGVEVHAHRGVCFHNVPLEAFERIPRTAKGTGSTRWKVIKVAGLELTFFAEGPATAEAPADPADPLFEACDFCEVAAGQPCLDGCTCRACREKAVTVAA